MSEAAASSSDSVQSLSQCVWLLGAWVREGWVGEGWVGEGWVGGELGEAFSSSQDPVASFVKLPTVYS